MPFKRACTSEYAGNECVKTDLARMRAQFCLHVKRCDFTPLENVSLNI